MKIIKITALIFITFLLGFITSVLYHAFANTINPKPIATLEIINKTSQNIKEVSIDITDGSGKNYSTVTYYELNKNKTINLPMYFERDGRYTVIYTLEDETVFTSGKGYVMNGDISLEVVTEYGVIQKEHDNESR